MFNQMNSLICILIITNPNLSNCYFTGQSEAEIINCTTGKDELGNPSRISKRGLFFQFHSLLGKINSKYHLDKITGLNYLDVKSSVNDYSVSIYWYI